VGAVHCLYYHALYSERPANHKISFAHQKGAAELPQPPF
jgi:hypothetical protein